MARLGFIIALAMCSQAGAAAFECAGPRQLPRAKTASPFYNPYGMVKLGSHFHALVVFAKFADEAPQKLRAPAYAKDLFDPKLPGSLAHFYHSMSAGQFNLEGTVLPTRYGSRHPASYYLAEAPGETGGFGRFATEILEQVDEDVDWRLFDNDGPDGIADSGDDDGLVDYVFVVVHSAPPDFILGSASGIAGLNVAMDQSPFAGFMETRDIGASGEPIKIAGKGRYGSLNSEGTFAQTVGTMAHELGHAFGLSDLYDTHYDGPEDDSAGIGRWGLMGRGAHGWTGNDGPAVFSAWSLEKLGWLGKNNDRLVEVVGDGAALPLQDARAGGSIYKIPLRIHSSHPRYQARQEYILLEQRTRAASYYNRNAPGEGLLIWHIRPHVSDNQDEVEKMVDLVCADGLYSDSGFPYGKKADGRNGHDNLDFWAHDGDYRRARGGNLGDATDPFDGVRFTRWWMAGNPSSDPQGLLSAASSGLDIEVYRDGEGMWANVSQPRWAGLISGEVSWGGQILVDGDVEIASQGRLLVYPGTQVKFAGGDRLAGGRDPTLSELKVTGSLALGAPFEADDAKKVHFGLKEDGPPWFGIVLTPEAGNLVDLPLDSYELHQAEVGIDMPGIPPGDPDQVLLDFQLVDESTPLAAGNGDGQLNPGETFGVVAEIANRSLTPYANLVPSLKWHSDRIEIAHKKPTVTNRLVLDKVDLGPGQRQVLRFADLNLDADIPWGAEIPFSLAMRSMDTAWADTVILPVVGRYPDYRVEFEVVGRRLVNQWVLVPDGKPVRVRVHIEGDITAAELVVVTASERELAAEIPLRIAADGEGKKTYTTSLQLPDPGLYLAQLRLHSSTGLVFFHESPLTVLSADLETERPVLVFIGERYENHHTLKRVISEILSLQGTKGLFLPVAPAEGPLYQLLLPHYAGRDGTIIWLGSKMKKDALTAMRQFLDSGGRMLMASLLFNLPPRQADFIRDVLHVEHVQESTRTTTDEIHSLAAEATIAFKALHFALELRPPAEPLLLNSLEKAAGLRLDTGIYRMVYLPFELNMTEATTKAVLEAGLAFLHQETSNAPLLKLGDIVRPGPIEPLQLLVPRVAVVNSGDRPSAPFLVGYEIRQNDRVIARPKQIEPGLEPRTERVIDLPAWSPEAEAQLQIRLGLSPSTEDTLVYQAAQDLKLVDVPLPFELVKLPAQSDMSNGAGFFDYDGDGDLDFYLARMDRANQLFRNQGAAFVEVASQAGVAEAGASRGLAVGDYDGDGDLDLYIINQGANTLYRNEGDGDFIAVEVGAEDPDLLADVASGRSAAFFDHDADGDIDLYLVNHLNANRLFDNEPQGFLERADALGLADGGNGRGLAVGDYDGDGDADLFLANREGGSRLYGNSDGGFIDVTRVVGLDLPGGEVAAVFGDYDGDSALDLFISNEKGTNRLYHNEGKSGFKLVGDEGGFSLGARTVGTAFLDYNNDGYLDLATTAADAKAGGDELYQNLGNQNLEAPLVPVGALLGLHPTSIGRALTFADYDRDGALDLLIADNGGAKLYRNTSDASHWLRLELEGTARNRDALGARVGIFAAERWQHRELQSGFGYGSQMQPLVHFGLGQAELVDTLRILWPDGAETVETQVRADQQLLVAQPHPISATGGADETLPVNFHLEPNFPNPFNAQTTFRYQLPERGAVELAVFNTLGQLVRRLIQRAQEPGRYTVAWDGADDRGQELATGVYIARLQVNAFVETRKIILVK